MQPVSISLMGFKCFYKQTRFDFPQKPGLYLISGRNEMQPELEGNGCGKSTLFTDALTWVLFGKTPRLLKAGDVINWEATTSSVDFIFTHNDEFVRVLRTQTPNSLSWAKGSEPLQTVSQDQLTDYLDIDFDSFVSSVVFSQFTSMFFDLSPADKSSLLSNILNLDVWDVASDRAKSKSQQIQVGINGTKQEISHLEGQIFALQQMNFDEKIDEWNSQQLNFKATLTAQETELTKQLHVIAAEGAVLQKDCNEFKESLASVVEIKTEIAQSIALLDRELQQHNWTLSGLMSKIDLAKKELSKFEKVSGQCPYCLQAVDEAHLKKEMQRIQQTIKKILTESSAIKGVIQAVEEGKRHSMDDLSETLSAEREFREDSDAVEKKLSSLKVSAMGFKRDLNTVTSRLKELESARNPYLHEEQQMLEKIAAFTGTTKQLKDSLSALEQDELNTTYWVKGFRDVRLMLISDVLTQLELEVNNHLFSLGLQDWKVNFAVDGLTKGGKIKKGFTVTITTPQITDPVPWAAWSGGETQRLRLAGALGMTDLILSKNKFDSNIEVFDEPSQYLSSQGITSLIQVLQDRARALNKMIFLIDHRYLDSQAFDGSFTVVKSADSVFVL
jgi:DNA repair exonuclease SbcCD ATPase subunit